MTRKLTAGLIPAAVLMTLVTLPLAAQTERPDLATEQEMTQQEMTQQEMTPPEARGTTNLSSLTLTGELVSFDQEAMRVRTVTGVESVVLTDQTTKPADLAAGDKVAVDFNRSAQGAMIASQVRKVSDAEMESTDQGAMDTMTGSEVMAQSTQTGSATTGSTTGSMDTTGSMADSTTSRPDPRANNAIAPTPGSTYGTGATLSPQGSTYGPGTTASDSMSATATADDATVLASVDTSSDTLPATGSNLPLAGLAGLLALGLAAGLRALVR